MVVVLLEKGLGSRGVRDFDGSLHAIGRCCGDFGSILVEIND